MIPTVGEAAAAATALVINRLHGRDVDVGRELATAPAVGAGGVPFAVCLALAIGSETVTHVSF